MRARYARVYAREVNTGYGFDALTDRLTIAQIEIWRFGVPMQAIAHAGCRVSPACVKPVKNSRLDYLDRLDEMYLNVKRAFVVAQKLFAFFGNDPVWQHQ